MTRYLLDTNIISDVFRNPGGQVVTALRQRHRDAIGVSVVVSGEVKFGLMKNRNLRGLERLKVLLDTMIVWPLESPVEDDYGKVRAQLEGRGTRLGPNDMWIAAHALALDAVLVTDDRAFLRVPELKVENWLRDTPAGDE